MIAVGAYNERGKTYYYAVVRGRASRRSYEGILGLAQALGEAHGDELFFQMREYAERLKIFSEKLARVEFEETLKDLAIIAEYYGIIAIYDESGSMIFTYTDETGKVPLEDDGSIREEARGSDPDEVLIAIQRALGPDAATADTARQL